MYLLSTVYQSWPVRKTPVRQVEELGKCGATASHTAWVRKGSQLPKEKLRSKRRRGFSQAKRRPKQGIHTVGVALQAER